MERLLSFLFPDACLMARDCSHSVLSSLDDGGHTVGQQSRIRKRAWVSSNIMGLIDEPWIAFFQVFFFK